MCELLNGPYVLQLQNKVHLLARNNLEAQRLHALSDQGNRAAIMFRVFGGGPGWQWRFDPATRKWVEDNLLALWILKLPD